VEKDGKGICKAAPRLDLSIAQTFSRIERGTRGHEENGTGLSQKCAKDILIGGLSEGSTESRKKSTVLKRGSYVGRPVVAREVVGKKGFAAHSKAPNKKLAGREIEEGREGGQRRGRKNQEEPRRSGPSESYFC